MATLLRTDKANLPLLNQLGGRQFKTLLKEE